MDAYHRLASEAGIFGEPASAASLAGLIKLAAAGHDFSRQRIVCVVTGTGLKDADAALNDAGSIVQVAAEASAVEAALGWK